MLNIHWKISRRSQINFYLTLTITLFLLGSCSVQKQIAKSADEVVLKAKALQTAHVGISIYEPATGKYWYNYQGDKYFVPASNTKIPTCYAAMKYLGDSLVGLRYEVEDSIVIVYGSGDPTFLHPDYSSSKILEFLKKFRAVVLNEEKSDFGYLGFGWTSDDYLASYMAERSSIPLYGNVIKYSLENNEMNVYPKLFSRLSFDGNGGILDEFKLKSYKGLDVLRKKERNDYKITPGTQKSILIPFHTRDYMASDRPNFLQAQLLGDTLNMPVHPGSLLRKVQKRIIYSQPTDSLLKPMMHRSDNFFAEQSLLMVSNERLGYMNDSKIIDTILKTDFKDLPQKPRWVDGSGLSRYNLFTPQDFVVILDKMQKEFPMSRIKEIFPTGGEGTISSYYKADSGFIYGKTGTLSGVVAFSGFMYTKKGKLLIFSTLINNHQASATDVRRAVEKFLQTIRNKY